MCQHISLSAGNQGCFPISSPTAVLPSVHKPPHAWLQVANEILGAVQKACTAHALTHTLFFMTHAIKYLFSFVFFFSLFLPRCDQLASSLVSSIHSRCHTQKYCLPQLNLRWLCVTNPGETSSPSSPRLLSVFFWRVGSLGCWRASNEKLSCCLLFLPGLSEATVCDLCPEHEVSAR